MYELGTLGNRDNIQTYGIELNDGSLLSSLSVKENIHTMMEEHDLYGDVALLFSVIKLTDNFVLLIFIDKNKDPIFVVADNDGNFIHNYGNLFKDQYSALRDELNITAIGYYPVSMIYNDNTPNTNRLLCIGDLGNEHNIISYINISDSTLSLSDNYKIYTDTGFTAAKMYSSQVFLEYNNSNINKIFRPDYRHLAFYDGENIVDCGITPYGDGNIFGTAVKDNCLFIFYERKVHIYIYNSSYFSQDNLLNNMAYTYDELVGEVLENQELVCVTAHIYNDDSFIIGLINRNDYISFFVKIDIVNKEEHGVEYYDLEYNGVIIDENKFKDESRRFYDYYYPGHLDPVNGMIYFAPFMSAYLNENNVVRNDVMFFITFIMSANQIGPEELENRSFTIALVGIKIEDDNLSVEWIDMSYTTSGVNDVIKWVLGFNMIDNRIYTQEFIGKSHTDVQDVNKLGVYDIKDAILPLECGNKYIREHGSDLGDPYEK